MLLVWIGKYGKQIVESLKDLISFILNSYEMLILNIQFCPRINLEIAEMKPQLTLTLVSLSYVHKSNWGMRISKENTGLCTISMKHVFVQVTWVITVHRNISQKGIMVLTFMVWLLSSLYSYMQFHIVYENELYVIYNYSYQLLQSILDYFCPNKIIFNNCI